MKRVLMLLFCQIILLTACNGTEEIFDSDRNFVRTSVASCSSDKSIYLLQLGKRDKAIYYADKGSNLYGALCGKPECKHDDATCDAYVSSPMSLSLYGDRLYWIDSGSRGYSLYSMKTDGSNRNTVRSLYTEVYNDFSNGIIAGWMVALHRGYLFASTEKYYIEEAMQSERILVVQMPINNSNNDRVILEREIPDEFNAHITIQPYLDDIYILVTIGQKGTEYADEAELLRWNISSQTLETVFNTTVLAGVSNHLWVTDNNAIIASFTGEIYSHDFKEHTLGYIGNINEGIDEPYTVFGFVDGYILGNRYDDEDDLSADVCVWQFDGQTVGDIAFSTSLRSHINDDAEIVNGLFVGSDENYVYYEVEECFNGYVNSTYLFAFPLHGGQEKIVWSNVQ